MGFKRKFKEKAENLQLCVPPHVIPQIILLLYLKCIASSPLWSILWGNQSLALFEDKTSIKKKKTSALCILDARDKDLFKEKKHIIQAGLMGEQPF